MKTNLRETEKLEIIISSLNGKLMLQYLPLKTKVEVYTTTGSKILEINASSINETITLNKGIYLFTLIMSALNLL